MRADVNLRLLFDSLRSLAIAPYFNNDVLQYNDQLCRAIDFALDPGNATPDPVLRELTHIVWTAHRYLSGSIFREAPYEVQYCLEQALKPWAKKKIIITTAVLDDPFNYHFLGLDPWAAIRTLLPSFDAKGFDRELALIGLPRLYRHKPVFCTPLYHELGHFVDKHWGVTNLTMLMSTLRLNNIVAGSISPNHWQEHFSDLFAASYIGRSSVSALEIISPGAPARPSHPSNADRLELVEKYLSNRFDPRIEALQMALAQLSAPHLIVRHTCPDVASAYDDLRPVNLETETELHGIFESASAYFSAGVNQTTSPWTGRETNISDLDKIVNDLTEKSIRTYSIRNAWSANVHSA